MKLYIVLFAVFSLALVTNANPTRSSRMGGGYEALSIHGNVVALKMASGGAGPSTCVGNLIGLQYVLTSAFCVEHAVHVDLIFGAHDISRQESTQVRMRSREIIIHPDWNPDTHANDIALIKLPNPVQTTDNIYTVDLIQTERNWLYDVGSIYGWGKTTPEGDLSDKLQTQFTTVVSHDTCEEMYGNLYDRNKHLCTTAKRAFCVGDEGGPMLYYVNPYTNLLAIASFGMVGMCDSGKYPAVYLRTYEYMDWLGQYTPVNTTTLLDI